MSLEIERVSPEEPTKPLRYTPRTKLGENLLAIRERILATGAPLLDEDEIEQEVAARRGEYHNKTI